MTTKRILLAAWCFPFFGLGCDVNVPFGGNDTFESVEDAVRDLQDAFTEAVADPLGARPFPVLIGGDDQTVYYATSLTDVRLRFPGPTTDVVFPSFVGPSNLYKFEESRRELIAPLVPGGAYSGLATDGRFVVYALADVHGSNPFSPYVFDLWSSATKPLLENGADESAYMDTIVVHGGRAAFAMYDETEDGFAPKIRVADLEFEEPTIEIELSFGTLDVPLAMRGDRLAYVDGPSGGSLQVLLRDLTSGETTVVADGIRAEYAPSVPVFLTDNGVVWSEPGVAGPSRVQRYIIQTGATSVWSDGVRGVLAGATDEHFVTEEFVVGESDTPDRWLVRKYNANGSSRKLAGFRADGLAGQTRVIGNRAAWVNPDREIVLAPLSGGERNSFRPF